MYKKRIYDAVDFFLRLSHFFTSSRKLSIAFKLLTVPINTNFNFL